MGVWNNVPSPNSGGISSLLFDVKIEYTHANSALYQQQIARLHKPDQRIAETRIDILIPLQQHLLKLRPDLRSVKKFTQPDFSPKNFTH